MGVISYFYIGINCILFDIVYFCYISAFSIMFHSCLFNWLELPAVCAIPPPNSASSSSATASSTTAAVNDADVSGPPPAKVARNGDSPSVHVAATDAIGTPSLVPIDGGTPAESAPADAPPAKSDGTGPHEHPTREELESALQLLILRIKALQMVLHPEITCVKVRVMMLSHSYCSFCNSNFRTALSSFFLAQFACQICGASTDSATIENYKSTKPAVLVHILTRHILSHWAPLYDCVERV